MHIEANAMAEAVAKVLPIAAFLNDRPRDEIDFGPGRPGPNCRGCRDLRFADRSDRGIDVIDAASGAVVAELAPGTHGFIRGMMRGLSRDRRVHRVGPEAPFTLARWSDGRYSVTDPSTGNVLHLAAFGFANVKEFADLLPAATATASLGEREVRR